MTADLDVIVTFHREGLLAHTALRSIFQARSHAKSEAISVQLIFVLDSPDHETRHIVRRHSELDASEIVLEVDVGDAAMARNEGLKASTSPNIAFVDGDDIVSRNYFTAHFEQLRASPENVILHPEVVVSFGMYNAFNWQVDQKGPFFDKSSLVTVNPWISASCARASVYEETPFEACYPQDTGFGYEDWHWNCETIAKGKVHSLAWGTLYCYRRKFSGSLNESNQLMKTVIPRSTLFDAPWHSGEHA